MTVLIKKTTGNILTLRKTYVPIDWEAADYARRVELADGQPLEEGVFNAINSFVIGCKSDGIWNAIKASCILAGARTLSGALVPLVGAAPTNYSFVTADYNRKTGLKGNASTKYLDTNRNNNADPQDNNHNAIYVTTPGTDNQYYMGAGNSAGATPGVNDMGTTAGRTNLFFRSRGSQLNYVFVGSATGLMGISRSLGASYTARANGSNITGGTSTSPYNGNVFLFSVNNSSYRTDARFAFYSIGESLNLALLDTRVTTLINAIAAAIP